MWCFDEQYLYFVIKNKLLIILYFYMALLVAKQSIKPLRQTKLGDQHPLKGGPARDIQDEHYKWKVNYITSILRSIIHCENQVIISFKGTV